MTKTNFEDALNHLEKITRDMENGDLSLEDSLKKFDEGIKLAELCNRKLDEAQKKVNILIKKNNKLVEMPFNEAVLHDE